MPAAALVGWEAIGARVEAGQGASEGPGSLRRGQLGFSARWAAAQAFKGMCATCKSRQ